MTIQQLSEVVALAEMQTFEKDCLKYDFDVKQAKLALQKMIGILPAPGVEQDPETRAAIYWDILKTELSPDAIPRVCRRALAGNIGNQKWLPTPGELIHFARNNWIQNGPVVVDPRRHQPAKALAPPEHKLLGREYSDEQFRADERARIADKLKTLAAEVRRSANDNSTREKIIPRSKYGPVVSRKELFAMNDGELEKHRIEAEDYIAAKYGDDKPLPKLSAETLAKLSACIPRIEE